MGRVEITTGAGKALGGASGGYTAARKEVVEWLRQRSRPYLFSSPAGTGHCCRVHQSTGDGRSGQRTA
ncbi:aminotransferase class I/II-fold pyridoxal phosphate-dependent enzyme [Escherichia coli]